MRFEFFQVVVFAIAFIAPLLIGFCASELFKGVTYGGSVSFLGVLVLALMIDGWHYAGNGMLQKVLLESLVVVPTSALLALVGYMAKRFFLYVRQDQRTAR